MPVAYLWTRTVTCKKPNCRATVPLLRQSWLCRKKDHYVALKMIAPKPGKRARFVVVESSSEGGLGFDPTGFSKAGNATCPFCGTVADDEYVKEEGSAGRMGTQAMAVVATQSGIQGKTYLSADSLASLFLPDDEKCRERISDLCKRTGLSVPDEAIGSLRPSPNARGLTAVCRHGIHRFGDLFTPRQLLSLLTIAAAIREASASLQRIGQDSQRAVAICAFLASNADKQADRNSTFCNLLADGGRGIKNTFSRQALSMTWDFAEANPFNPDIASWESCFKEVLWNIEDLSFSPPASPCKSWIRNRSYMAGWIL